MEASISFWRAMRSFQNSATSALASLDQLADGSRGTSHSAISGGTSAVYFCFARYAASQPAGSAWVRSSRNGASLASNFSQMTSISVLLAMDFSVICGTRS
ncbi:MAG: hypothetical protein BWY57_03442 [Betaproteobacteria bacterium ADurb.Bin341]|nr:MAG: hypothetical protein BWY57_03442 [Betaproteobacteria bacterium ADurb.Bin341]